MATKVTIKGQVTIPKAVREQMGIGPGSKIDFKRSADGRIVIERAGVASPQPSRLTKLVGSAGKGPTTDEIMALLRGDPE